jgi:hypothetical protein
MPTDLKTVAVQLAALALGIAVVGGSLIVALGWSDPLPPPRRPGDDDGSQSSWLKSGKKTVLPPGKEMFAPTHEWQPVLDHHVLPAGCEIQMDMSTGKNRARISSNTRKSTALRAL